jgi:hypothetical protein
MSIIIAAIIIIITITPFECKLNIALRFYMYKPMHSFFLSLELRETDLSTQSPPSFIFQPVFLVQIKAL